MRGSFRICQFYIKLITLVETQELFKTSLGAQDIVRLLSKKFKVSFLSLGIRIVDEKKGFFLFQLKLIIHRAYLGNTIYICSTS